MKRSIQDQQLEPWCSVICCGVHLKPTSTDNVTQTMAFSPFCGEETWGIWLCDCENAHLQEVHCGCSDVTAKLFQDQPRSDIVHANFIFPRIAA